jgi:hypothetical protein
MLTADRRKRKREEGRSSLMPKPNEINEKGHIGNTWRHIFFLSKGAWHHKKGAWCHAILFFFR